MVVAVFKSKTDVFTFIEKARYFGLGVSVISTPKEFKMGCGLSVKVGKSQLELCKRVLFSYSFSTFYGLFIIQKNHGITNAKRVL